MSDYTEDDAFVCSPSKKPEIFELVEEAFRRRELFDDMARGIRLLRTMFDTAGLTAGVEATDALLERIAAQQSASGSEGPK